MIDINNVVLEWCNIIIVIICSGNDASDGGTEVLMDDATTLASIHYSYPHTSCRILDRHYANWSLACYALLEDCIVARCLASCFHNKVDL